MILTWPISAWALVIVKQELPTCDAITLSSVSTPLNAHSMLKPDPWLTLRLASVVSAEHSPNNNFVTPCNSEAPTASVAISLEPTALAAISAAFTSLSFIFAAVTCPLPISAVLTSQSTISLENIVFAACARSSGDATNDPATKAAATIANHFEVVFMAMWWSIAV